MENEEMPQRVRQYAKTIRGYFEGLIGTELPRQARVEKVTGDAREIRVEIVIPHSFGAPVDA
jgi:hypothetical protein